MALQMYFPASKNLENFQKKGYHIPNVFLVSALVQPNLLVGPPLGTCGYCGNNLWVYFMYNICHALHQLCMKCEVCMVNYLQTFPIFHLFKGTAAWYVFWPSHNIQDKEWRFQIFPILVELWPHLEYLNSATKFSTIMRLNRVKISTIWDIRASKEQNTILMLLLALSQ